jgi:branched-chain amino acid transport system substrate-binding protein
MRKNSFRIPVLIGSIVVFLGLSIQIFYPTPIHAEEVFKIGVPTALSGAYAQYGIQQKRTVEMMLPEIEAKGLLGRKVEFIWEDSKGDPATAVRKARKLVEKDGVKFLLGPPLSSEALAVSAMLPRWKAIYISSINGAGKLTGSKFNRYFFRVNTSAPMESRTIALYMKDSPLKSFYGIGSDYAWPRSSVGAFEQQVKEMGKQWAGSIFAPLGTFDWATYIAKIKEAKPDALYVAIPGKDGVAFYSQVKKFGLSKEVQIVLSIVELMAILGTGDAMENFIGNSRYPFTIDSPKNKAFVEKFYKKHNFYPDMFDGETYEALEFFFKAVTKAGTDDVDAVIQAWEGLEYDGLEGKFLMRACDHQASQPGFMVRAVKAEGYPHLIPKIIKTYTGEQITPPCRKDSF